LICDYCFSQGWFATPQDVLQADWQDVWHSPQPPFCTDLFKSRVAIVLILLIFSTSLKVKKFLSTISYTLTKGNNQVKHLAGKADSPLSQKDTAKSEVI